MRLILPCPHGYHGEHFLHAKWPEVGSTKCEPTVAITPADVMALLARHGFATSPGVIAFVREVASLTKDGEYLDGDVFVMENDDAFDTLHSLIGQARELLGQEADRTPNEGGHDGV